MDDAIQNLINYADEKQINIVKEVTAWLDGLLTYNEAYNRLAARIAQATKC
ncbi:MAG: hypothetical protein Q8L68_04890 [Methylococcales bacterium]|nr:hypothetical protein [Methylococcales bacterium]